MQIGPSGLPLPVPIPMWYYNPCFRLPENPLHPAFTRALYAPMSPTQNSPHAPNSPYLMNDCTTTAPSTPEETTPSITNDKSDPALKMESKGKNTSFSIEAILELGENRRETPSEQKESKALSDRRHQRVIDSAHPYVTSSSSYTTNHHHHHHHHHHHPFNVHNEQLAVLRESTNILIEDDITPRMSNTASHVASMVTPDWKHQSPHHHHHHHHQPASQQHQQHPHHHHQQQQQVPPNSHPTGHLEPRPTSISLPRVQTKTSSSSVKSGKRVRTIFTPEQLEQLELEFSRQQYMVGTERYYLAGKLSLSEVQVKVWFQNRRIKMRKQQQEAIKEHFAQCRFLNTSESEEEDEEEDEEEGGGERERVEEGRREEEDQEEGEGEGEDLEEEEGVEERERERRVDSDNSHLLLKYHQKMKNLRDLVTEHCPRD